MSAQKPSGGGAAKNARPLAGPGGQTAPRPAAGSVEKRRHLRHDHRILVQRPLHQRAFLAVNLVGDGLRDRLDPRLARRM